MADEAAERPLVARVGVAVRKMGAQSVLLSNAMAALFGLTTTELECLDVLFMREEASAGDLARATGLTSGAMTALLDRLERAGYVARRGDPSDRRRVLLRIRPEAIAPIEAMYAPLAERSFALWASFSDAELAIVERFLARSLELGVSCTQDLQAGTGKPPARRRGTRPGPRRDAAGHKPSR
jgi:DNA-binding MarR family transcriptional regulator